jgi:hypothetical protein
MPSRYPLSDCYFVIPFGNVRQRIENCFRLKFK